MKKYEIRKATAQLKKSQKNLIEKGITWTFTPDIDDITVESFDNLENAMKIFKEKYSISRVSGFETFFIEEYYVTETNYDDDGNSIDPWENAPIVWSEMPELD